MVVLLEDDPIRIDDSEIFQLLFLNELDKSQEHTLLVNVVTCYDPAFLDQIKVIIQVLLHKSGFEALVLQV